MIIGLNSTKRFTKKEDQMNNTLLLEKLSKHYLQNIPYNENFINEEVFEMSLYGGIGQFIKDSIKYLAKIKRLKPDDEIIIDLIEPIGFMSIYKDDKTYELNLAIKGQKTRTFRSQNAGQIVAKVLDVFKDQILVGRKNLKNQYR